MDLRLRASPPGCAFIPSIRQSSFSARQPGDRNLHPERLLIYLFNHIFIQTPELQFSGELRGGQDWDCGPHGHGLSVWLSQPDGA